MPFPYTFPLTLGPMQVLYPNIIYHPSSGTEIFIDSLQRVDHAADAEVVSYRSSVDGSLRSFTRDVGARQMSLSCKIRQENEQTMRRLLNYLRGEEVYLMVGAEEMATVGRIQSFSIPKSVGTYTPLSIEFTCDTDLEGQFWEAEDSTLMAVEGGVTTGYDSGASMGHAVMMSIIYAGCFNIITQSAHELPVGDYIMFARAKDDNQVPNDLKMEIYNLTESSVHTSASKTVTSGYRVYEMEFSIDSDDIGDRLYLAASKGTGAANVLSVDYLGFVRM